MPPDAKAPTSWTVPAALHGKRLDAALKALSRASWEQARKMIARGKVTLDGAPGDGARIVLKGMRIALDLTAPSKKTEKIRAIEIVHLDHATVVVMKPAGVSTVPFGDEPDPREDTLDALVRAALGRKLGGGGRRSAWCNGSTRRRAASSCSPAHSRQKNTSPNSCAITQCTAATSPSPTAMFAPPRFARAW